VFYGGRKIILLQLPVLEYSMRRQKAQNFPGLLHHRSKLNQNYNNWISPTFLQ